MYFGLNLTHLTMLGPLNTQYLSNITDNVGLVSTVVSNDRAKRHEVAQGDREVFASLNF